MDLEKPVSPATFNAIQNVDIDQLSTLSDSDLRPILPCLVRMSLCAALDSSEKWTKARKSILKCLSGIEVVNSLVGLLSIDFHALEQDARKEQQLRSKVSGGSNLSESVLISQLENGVALEFERSDAARKLRLLLSELLFVISQIKETRNGEFYFKKSELFECEVSLDEVSDVLCIAQAELPGLLPMSEVGEALLHVKNGTWLLCRLVANVPDSFEEVVESLVSHGERQDEDSPGGAIRVNTLKTLCQMCPSHALTVRALCVEHCKLPSLAILLTLPSEDQSQPQSQGGQPDVIAFITGLLLGNDVTIRSWMAQYIRAGQKRKDASCGFHRLRVCVLRELHGILPAPDSNYLAEEAVVPACAFIKLYCAMKSIAALRFSEEETQVLLNLITCQPPYTSAGIRFVSLSLCMLLAAPYLLGSIEEERQAVEWLKWLVKESGNFETHSGENSTFGEMLLLIAIHFHSNQTTAIADLVSSTLGMKSPVKANSLARIKTMFTQEIFTEQAVTSHAVRVAVTKQLTADMTGYLPIHCVYQLLKSRAFSKHKVPIKGWIFSQICDCSTPLHPLITSLIEVYVNSIILPGHKSERTNEPISEQEILSVFKHSAVAKHFSGSKVSKGSSSRVTGLRMMSESMDQPLSGDEATTNLTAQLLLVYYVLLYNDTLLSSVRSIVSRRRSVPPYSSSLLAQLPMKYLLQQAQRQHQLYASLYAPLLRLLSSHYPHLCLVEDWMDEELTSPHPSTAPNHQKPTVDTLDEAFLRMSESPTVVVLLLEQLATLETTALLPYSDVIIQHLRTLVQSPVPRKILELVKAVWFKLNTAMPRKLRVLTVNSLTLSGTYSEEDLTMDPLLVLRCDSRVYQCPPLMEVLLRVLDAFLRSSRTYLNNHIQTQQQQASPDEPATAGADREELKNALLSAQESAAIQLLLEACLITKDEGCSSGSLLSNQREVQCLVCSQLHRMFIDDPNLAKLVHFQGYPSELLSVTVPGIPSMHICLDFIPELISQPHLDKTMFAIDLVSHLSLQYALPKSMSVAKLAVSTLTTLLTVLSSESRPVFFVRTLPSVVRISKAFPALGDDIISFLIQLARVTNSHLANVTDTMVTELACAQPFCPETGQSEHITLCQSIHHTFTQVIMSTRLMQHRGKPGKPRRNPGETCMDID